MNGRLAALRRPGLPQQSWWAFKPLVPILRPFKAEGMHSVNTRKRMCLNEEGYSEMLEEKRRDSAPKAKQNGQRNGRGKAAADQNTGTLYDAAALQQVSEAERAWETGSVAQATARMPERTANV